MGHKNFKNKHQFKGGNQTQGVEENTQEKNMNEVSEPVVEPVEAEEISPEAIDSEENGVEASDLCAEAEKQVEELKTQLEKEKKEYLFLMAEFDNFRKRTLKEKSEIIKNAGENFIKGLLPIIDDFERGLKAAETNADSDSMKEGISLIYNKLIKYLNQNGVKEIDPKDDSFDTEKHEAISAIPVPDEDKKGKILDTVEKGYMINDKVLRHAKVVVAQ